MLGRSESGLLVAPVRERLVAEQVLRQHDFPLLRHDLCGIVLMGRIREGRIRIDLNTVACDLLLKFLPDPRLRVVRVEYVIECLPERGMFVVRCRRRSDVEKTYDGTGTTSGGRDIRSN